MPNKFLEAAKLKHEKGREKYGGTFTRGDVDYLTELKEEFEDIYNYAKLEPDTRLRKDIQRTAECFWRIIDEKQTK